MLAQLLARLQVAGNVIEPLVDVFRREPVRAPRASFDSLPEAIHRMPVATHEVKPGERAIGRSLFEIDLRATTNATILAIQSGSAYTTSPSADARIQAGDMLYLLGDDSDIALARHRIATGR